MSIKDSDSKLEEETGPLGVADLLAENRYLYFSATMWGFQK